MKIFSFIVFFIFALTLKSLSQNLIPNPGFDIITDCPTAVGQIYLAYPWQRVGSAPVVGASLFNKCSKDNGFAYPPCCGLNNSCQNTRSGNGYAYMHLFYSGSNIPASSYIITPLLSPMKKGKNYYLKFYVSPDDNTTLLCFMDAVGLALTDTFYNKELGEHEVFPLVPAIESKEVIEDTINWTKISGCYRAKGGESFAIIGNFRGIEETSIICYGKYGKEIYPLLISQFIEDVGIWCFDPLPDTILICKGESIKLNAGFLNASYLWNTGSIDSSLIINTPGIYSVNAYIDTCVLQDTVVVLDNTLWEDTQFDTLLCDGEKITLKPPVYGNYQWSTGTTSKSITVNKEGKYIVDIVNKCGEYEYSYNVDYEICDCIVNAPNIFTPDNDGINDIMKIHFDCDFEYKIKEFRVFDRWGENIYFSNDMNLPEWDAIFKGKFVSSGVYVWVLKYDIFKGDKIINKIATGDVTVIR